MPAEGHYYRESGKIDPLRLAVAAPLLVATTGLAGAVVGAASHVTAVAGVATAIALMACLHLGVMRTWKSAHVRSTPLAVALGLLGGGVAAWVAAVTKAYLASAAGGEEAALLCLAPDVLTWVLPRLTPEGAVADSVVVSTATVNTWLATGCVLVLVPGLSTWLASRRVLFCEGCGRPVDEVVRLVCGPISDPEVFRGGLEEEHYDVLLNLDAGAPEDGRHSRVTLYDCGGCEAHSYLDVVVMESGKAIPVVRHLALWHDVYAELERRSVGAWGQAHTELGEP